MCCNFDCKNCDDYYECDRVEKIADETDRVYEELRD